MGKIISLNRIAELTIQDLMDKLEIIFASLQSLLRVLELRWNQHAI